LRTSAALAYDRSVALGRLPRTYHAFALVFLVGAPVAMLASGDRIEHFWRGLAIVLFLLWRLARRGHIVWALLLVWNTFLALSAIAIGGPGGWTVGAPLMLACSAACVVLLLTPSMREHVGVRVRRRGVSRA
jgi:hypothetical protein